MIEVAQADRDAAADYWRDMVAKVGEVLVEQGIRNGQMDDMLPVQSFARHRIASQAELIEALEKIARAQCTSVDVRSDDLTDSWHYLKSIAREAIAKAKGEA